MPYAPHPTWSPLFSGQIHSDLAGVYGYEFGTAASRLAAMDEGLQRIHRRWQRLNPPPTRKIPILVGGNGERKTLRSAAIHADIWHGFGDVAQLAHKHRVLDDWCAAVGRDPGEIERSTRVFRRGPEQVGQALMDVGTRFITVVGQAPDFDVAPVRDWLDFRDDMNKRLLATAAS